MNKKILFLGSIFALSVSQVSAQLQWDNSTGGVVTSTAQDVSIGINSLPGTSKLFVINGEDITAPSSLPTLQLKKNLYGFAYSSGYTVGNLFEGITEDLTGFPTPSSGPITRGCVLTTDFRFGIGTDAPIDRLNVHNGNIAMTYLGDAKERKIYGTTMRKYLGLYANTDGKNGPAIDLHGSGYTSEPGTIKFTSFDKAGKFVFGKWDVATSTLQRHIVIDEIGDINMVRWHDDASARKILANSHQSGLQLFSNTSSNDGGAIELYSQGHSSYKGSIHFVANRASDINGEAFVFVNNDNAHNYVADMVIYKNGKVRIGDVPTATTYDYKLYVEKGILTERLKVALKTTGDWSDYVFADDYDLKSLDEVESFINANKHLPGVPSAQEVVNTGIDVAEMDATLLKKVEELTLYIIEQNKRIQSLEAKQLNATK
jgi:hypothetical protein